MIYVEGSVVTETHCTMYSPPCWLFHNEDDSWAITLVGVAERTLGTTFAPSLRDGGVVHTLMVCGAEGLDKI